MPPQYRGSTSGWAEYMRLEALAGGNIEYARDGCRRVGMRPGASVTDVGWGVPYALLVLAEIVGPHGHDIGVVQRE